MLTRLDFAQIAQPLQSDDSRFGHRCGFRKGQIIGLERQYVFGRSYILGIPTSTAVRQIAVDRITGLKLCNVFTDCIYPSGDISVEDPEGRLE